MNNLLPGFEMGEEAMYRQALAQPLGLKVKKAIGFLQLHEPPEGYYLAYSGGKDSGVQRQHPLPDVGQCGLRERERVDCAAAG